MTTIVHENVTRKYRIVFANGKYYPQHFQIIGEFKNWVYFGSGASDKYHTDHNNDMYFNHKNDAIDFLTNHSQKYNSPNVVWELTENAEPKLKQPKEN